MQYLRILDIQTLKKRGKSKFSYVEESTLTLITKTPLKAAIPSISSVRRNYSLDHSSSNQRGHSARPSPVCCKFHYAQFGQIQEKSSV